MSGLWGRAVEAYRRDQAEQRALEEAARRAEDQRRLDGVRAFLRDMLGVSERDMVTSDGLLNGQRSLIEVHGLMFDRADEGGVEVFCNCECGNHHKRLGVVRSLIDLGRALDRPYAEPVCPQFVLGRLGPTAPPDVHAGRRRGWALEYAACVVCGSTNRPHEGRGRCSRCYAAEKANRGKAAS